MLAGELDGEGREDQTEVAPIFKISQAEERSSALPIRKLPFGNRLVVVLPVAVSPFSQWTGGLAKFLVQSSIASKTTPRAPLREPLRSLW